MFWKKKKAKQAGSLVFGLDLKECAKCPNNTRPCIVAGKSALFHRWVEDEKALLRINTFVRPEVQMEIVRRFREEGVFDSGCSVEKQCACFGLVEWLDGSVARVAPEDIHFLDRYEPGKREFLSGEV